MTAAHDEAVAAQLALRAAALAQPVEHRQDGSLDLLLLSVADQQVAVPIGDLREVRPPERVTPVPGSSALLPGLLGGPGGGLAAVSLAALLGLDGALPADQQWSAVLDDPRSPVGLLADQALDITTAHPDELIPTSAGGGLVAALLPSGALVLATAEVLRDPRLSLDPLDPLDPTKEPS